MSSQIRSSKTRSLIKVYCTAEEKQVFESKARSQGLSNSSYGRIALLSSAVSPQALASQEKLYLRLGELYLLLSSTASDLAVLRTQEREDIRWDRVAQLLPQLLGIVGQVRSEIQRLAESLRPPEI